VFFGFLRFPLFTAKYHRRVKEHAHFLLKKKKKNKKKKVKNF